MKRKFWIKDIRFLKHIHTYIHLTRNKKTSINQSNNHMTKSIRRNRTSMPKQKSQSKSIHVHQRYRYRIAHSEEDKSKITNQTVE